MNIKIANVYISLIGMYLNTIDRYESGTEVRRMKMDKDMLGKERADDLIDKTIERINRMGSVPYDELSEKAKATVNDLEERGIFGLNIQLF